LTLTSLVDDKFGNLVGKGSCVLPPAIPAGDSYTCSFSGEVVGNAGLVHTNTVTATGHDDDSASPVSAQDDATVTLTDSAPSIKVTKTADPVSLPEPGGSVTYTVKVENTSPASSDPLAFSRHRYTTCSP